MLRKLLWFAAVIVLLLVLVAGAAVFLIFRSKDEIVRQGAERAIAYALDVPATINSATLDINSQSVEFRGVHIPNPKGYSNNDAIVFGSVRAEVDVMSFRTEKRIIRLIRIADADVLLEKSIRTTNLQALIDNASRVARRDEQEAPPAEPSRATMVIERMLVENTTVRLKLAGLPGATPSGILKLADMELTDVGGEGEEVTPAQALERFLALLLESIRRSGSGLLPDDLLKSMDQTLDGLPSDVTNEAKAAAGQVTAIVLDAAGNALKVGEKAAGEAKEALEGVTGRIGGMLGGSKKEDSDAKP